MGVCFCITFVVSNLLECKAFQVGGVLLTGGFVVFPLTCILNDCITEIWGWRNARMVIVSAFFFNLLAVVFFNVVALLPPAPFWEDEEKFNFVFTSATRITFASFVAFLAGSMVNSYLMDKMKHRMDGKRFSFRALFSTFIGEGLDSLIFFPIAFYGVYSNGILLEIMLTQIVLKTLYEWLFLPFSSLIIKKVR